MRQRDVFSDQASIASWALFTLHRKKLYEYRNANEQNISVKMRSPEHYSRNNNILLKNRRLFQEREQGIQGVKLLDMGIRERGLTEWSILS